MAQDSFALYTAPCKVPHRIQPSHKALPHVSQIGRKSSEVLYLSMQRQTASQDAYIVPEPALGFCQSIWCDFIEC